MKFWVLKIKEMKSIINILFFCCLLSSTSIVIYSQNGSSKDDRDINFVYSEKLFPKVDLRDAKGSIELWTREIAADMKVSYSFSNEFIQGISTVDNDYIDQEIDLIVLSALEYLVNYEKLKNLSPIIVAAENGKVGVEYLILVHKENNFNSLSDLENNTITFVDEYSSAIPQVWLDVILKTNGLAISNTFFKKIEVSKNTNQAILKTFFKQVGACVVPKNLYESSVEINPQLAKDLVILKQSELFIVGVLCSHNKLNKDLKVDVIQSAKKILQSIKGRQFAIFFRTGELADFKSEHIESLRMLVNNAEKYNINLNR